MTGRLRLCGFSRLIIPGQQSGCTVPGHYHCVIVSRDATNRTVLLGIAVHAQNVISVGIIAEKVTEKAPMIFWGSLVVY